jgi:hypothetical protein
LKRTGPAKYNFWEVIYAIEGPVDEILMREERERMAPRNGWGLLQ